MEPKFQTSFIPKKPLVVSQGRDSYVVHETNIFSITATILFIATLAVSGGLFLYKTLLVKQIQEADKAINDARAAFQPEKIKDLIAANSRIVSAKGILDQHNLTSALLLFLEQLTLKNVRLDELTFKDKSGAATLSVLVEAGSYNALAVQSDAISKNDSFKNFQFSEFVPEDNGFIKARLTANMDPVLTSFKQAVTSVQTPQQ